MLKLYQKHYFKEFCNFAYFHICADAVKNMNKHTKITANMREFQALPLYNMTSNRIMDELPGGRLDENGHMRKFEMSESAVYRVDLILIEVAP